MSGTRARKTVGCSHAFSLTSNHIIISPNIDRCAPAEKQNVEKARNLGWIFTIDCIYAIFLSRGDRQMTEIFVSGTEVFSGAKMTETPYE